MKLHLHKLACLTLISFLSVSCGTIGGMGKDLQYLGGKMEAAEHRRLFKPKASSPTDTSIPPVDPVADSTEYPAYPDYPAQ